MRVSVVEVRAEQVVFAPHTEVRWLVRDLVDDCGDARPEVGQVGEFLEDADPSGWMFDVDSGWRVELAGLTAIGRPDVMTFQVNSTKIVVDLIDHGVPMAMKNRAATRLKFWRLVRCGEDVSQAQDPKQLQGHFSHPDVTSWVAEVEQATLAEAQRRRDGEPLRRKRKMEQESQDYFVNPYTFVPFPAEPPQRHEPHGHHTLAPDDNGDKARFAGRITAQLVARSPLLVRNIGSAAPTVGDVARAPRTSAGRLFIPGSSLHGAIRSLHETLAGSCLRVFDPDFVPVYRDVASDKLRKGWDLGVVDEVDHAGRPTKLTRCDETRWVPLETLFHATPTPGVVTTGQRFTLNESEFSQQHGRQVYRKEAEATLDPKGAWVVLVTDDGARQNEYPYYCAVGRMPTGQTPIALTDHAWHAYLRAVEGAKQWFAREKTPPSFEAELKQLEQPGASIGNVLGDPTLVREQGRWLRPRRWLHQGQVVWLAPSKGRLVDGMALSYLWRTTGQGSTGERLPGDGFYPCHDPKLLCPSCRVFGSADVRDVSEHGVDRRLAEQRSYRGHVRVLDAVLESGGEIDEVELPAMGSPRPGSGQFYLDDPQHNEAQLEYQKPRNRWGTPDPIHPRRLRGRKFYWHTDPQTDERRQRWRKHAHAPGGEKVELVATGSVYQLEMVFDGLTEAEIGGLVATLQPERLFATQQRPLPYPVTGDPEYAIHVGGGKPLGLGSCQVMNLKIISDSIESRYLGAEQPVVDPADLIAAFVKDRGDPGSTWQDVAAALHTDHVDSRIVSYPTAFKWADDDGTCSGTTQHRAFKWFQQTTGEDLRPGERPFVPLPSVSDIAPVLPVNVREGR